LEEADVEGLDWIIAACRHIRQRLAQLPGYQGTKPERRLAIDMDHSMDHLRQV